MNRKFEIIKKFNNESFVSESGILITKIKRNKEREKKCEFRKMIGNILSKITLIA